MVECALGRCSGCSRRTAEWVREIARRIKLEFIVEVSERCRQACPAQP